MAILFRHRAAVVLPERARERAQRLSKHGKVLAEGRRCAQRRFDQSHTTIGAAFIDVRPIQEF